MAVSLPTQNRIPATANPAACAQQPAAPSTTYALTRSRSKRSTTNLSNLRLAPLSTKFEPPEHQHEPQDGTESSASPSASSVQPTTSPSAFARHHSSYLQDRSAPTTPGILSRSSSRSYLASAAGDYDNVAAGTTTTTMTTAWGQRQRRRPRRQSDLEPDEEPYLYYHYSGADASGAAARAEVGSGLIPKAQSEAALLQRRAGRKTKPTTSSGAGTRSGGASTPVLVVRSGAGNRSRISRGAAGTGTEDDWVTRAGMAANSLLRESRGKSWLNLRDAAASASASTAAAAAGAVGDSTDEDEGGEACGPRHNAAAVVVVDDDEGYEEMAAISALAPRHRQRSGKGADEGDVTPRTPGPWGSRYGSRAASRRTSRRGSVVGSRTPVAWAGATSASGGGTREGYFDDMAEPAGASAPRFTAGEEEEVEEENGVETEDEEHTITRLATSQRSSWFGAALVDRVMNLGLFNINPSDRDEGQDDDGGIMDFNRAAPTLASGEDEESVQALRRRQAEVARRREEKERLVALPGAAGAGEEGEDEEEDERADPGWRDAAWLLSVAARAMFAGSEEEVLDPQAAMAAQR